MKNNPDYDDNYLDDILYVGKVLQYENNPKFRYRHMTFFISPDKAYLTNKNKDEKAIPMNFSSREDKILYESSGGRLNSLLSY